MPSQAQPNAEFEQTYLVSINKNKTNGICNYIVLHMVIFFHFIKPCFPEKGLSFKGGTLLTHFSNFGRYFLLLKKHSKQNKDSHL